MGTPFITFLEHGRLTGFQRGMPPDAQPSSVPQTFLDAMEVRMNVCVEEQGVPVAHEFDADDPRSCHWVVYASVNKTEELEVRDQEGNIVQPRKSSTRSTPIGTVRLVPFPHDPHPVAGGIYLDNVLQGAQEKEREEEEAAEAAGRAVGAGPLRREASSLDHAQSPRHFRTDRPTTFHDGKEPYVKLGRLSVIKGFRGHHIAGLLVNTTLRWLQSHPSYFDPSVTELGLEHMGAPSERDIPKWGGLVCVHAQEQVVGAWEKWGFTVDEGMGTWWEEGIKHVGMFQRIGISAKGFQP